MTQREKFILSLEGKQPPGRVPHFELVFYLTMEAFGKVHPVHRQFDQWNQMSAVEKKLQREDIADTYIQIANEYEHSAIFYQCDDIWKEKVSDETLRILELIKERSNEEYFLMIHGDRTWDIPSGDKMMEFITKMTEKPEELKSESQRMIDVALENALEYKKHGVLDCFALCSDYCFNNNPFLSPSMFNMFVTPYLKQLVSGYKELGFYVIKHTDGNIMPIIDQILSSEPHALHSLDPQGGVDIAEVKNLYGDQLCLIGNVNCGLMSTGSDEEIRQSAKYALENGMPGGGYIFSTSNCIYTGMPLRSYDIILDVWKEYGNYPD